MGQEQGKPLNTDELIAYFKSIGVTVTQNPDGTFNADDGSNTLESITSSGLMQLFVELPPPGWDPRIPWPPLKTEITGNDPDTGEPIRERVFDTSEYLRVLEDIRSRQGTDGFQTSDFGAAQAEADRRNSEAASRPAPPGERRNPKEQWEVRDIGNGVMTVALVEAKTEELPPGEVETIGDRQFIRQPDGSLREISDRNKTIDQQIAAMVESGDLDRAFELDAIRDQLNRPRGLTPAQAVEFIGNLAVSPDEFRAWIDALTVDWSQKRGVPLEEAAATFEPEKVDPNISVPTGSDILPGAGEFIEPGIGHGGDTTITRTPTEEEEFGIREQPLIPTRATAANPFASPKVTATTANTAEPTTVPGLFRTEEEENRLKFLLFQANEAAKRGVGVPRSATVAITALQAKNPFQVQASAVPDASKPISGAQAVDPNTGRANTIRFQGNEAVFEQELFGRDRATLTEQDALQQILHRASTRDRQRSFVSRGITRKSFGR